MIMVLIHPFEADETLYVSMSFIEIGFPILKDHVFGREIRYRSS